MVPASVPGISLANHGRGSDRPLAFTRLASVALGSFAAALTVAPSPADERPPDIRWTRAFVAGSVDREIADSRGLTAGPADIVELYAALEGERDGLPIFCCEIKGLRVDGRPLPERLVLTPEEAGVHAARLEWTLLRPGANGRGWRRTRLPGGTGFWDHAVFEIQPDSTTGIEVTLGTARYAVGVALRDAKGANIVLESDGARVRARWDDPQQAPGFRVTRHGGDSLPERALGLAGLPIRQDASRIAAIARVALAPSDVFVVAYEDLCGAPFGAEPLPALDGPGWEWLLEKVATARRRSGSDAPFVGPDGRPVAWRRADDPDSAKHVVNGDVAVVGEWVAFLEGDDGDGYLANADRALHGASGRLARGTLAQLPEGHVTILRVRNLRNVARDLSSAGYGPLASDPLWSPRARRAMKEFQRDRGLPLTAKPDAPTLQALRTFLARLDAPSAGSDSSR